jgi:hypothetical protein
MSFRSCVDFLEPFQKSVFVILGKLEAMWQHSEFHFINPLMTTPGVDHRLYCGLRAIRRSIVQNMYFLFLFFLQAFNKVMSFLFLQSEAAILEECGHPSET